jgi:hypothetical protein
MARAAAASLDEIVFDAVQGVISRASRAIASAIAEMAAAELEKQLAVRTKGRGRVSRVTRTRPSRTEITKWIADRNARRVPTFVIKATGLDTKKKIVAKYGENAAFEKGKPLPSPTSETSEAVVTSRVKTAARTVKAKAPRIRKKRAATAQSA